MQNKKMKLYLTTKCYSSDSSHANGNDHKTLHEIHWVLLFSLICIFYLITYPPTHLPHSIFIRYKEYFFFASEYHHHRSSCSQVVTHENCMAVACGELQVCSIHSGNKGTSSLCHWSTFIISIGKLLNYPFDVPLRLLRGWEVQTQLHKVFLT
jgi:hypothetical protein